MSSGAGTEPKSVPLQTRMEIGKSVTSATDDLLAWRNFAAAIAFSTIIVALIFGTYIRNISQKIVMDFTMDLDKIAIYGRIMVVVYIVFLVVLWVYAGTDELRLLQKWLRSGHYRITRPLSLVVTFIVLSLYFAVLALSSSNLVLFFSIYAGYLVLDIFAWRLRRVEIRQGLDKAAAFLASEINKRKSTTTGINDSDRHVAEIYETAFKSIDEFYFSRPQIRRVVVSLILTLFFAAISIMCHMFYVSGKQIEFSKYVTLKSGKIVLEYGSLAIHYDEVRLCAYLLFIAMVVLSERILHKWREQMKDELANLDVKLFELQLS